MDSDMIYDLTVKIALTSGHAKRKLLMSDLKDYLVAAYDPFIMYGIKSSPVGEGSAKFDVETWALLEGLARRLHTGDLAKMLVNEHVSRMTKKSAILFNRIINKDLRIGMRAKSINAVYPGLIPTHDVMLAKLFSKTRAKFPCYGGPKIDGIRGTYKHKLGAFFTRNGHRINGLEHLELQLGNINADLDGELFIPNATFQQSSGNIRSDGPSPNAVFAMFEVPGTNMPFIERLHFMEMVAKSRTNIFRLKHYVIANMNHLYEFYNWCRKRGYEGAVIRPMDYEYVGTRSYNWMKLKNIMDFDLEVVDMFEGQGKYKGQLGGVMVSYNNKLQRVGGGFSDRQRKTWWENPSHIMGKTIQVVVTEFTDDGNFRHARMGTQGIRRDK
jgi:DNA ligase-1